MFDDKLWTSIFSEVSTFIEDMSIDESDLSVDSDTPKKMIAERKAGMFRGTPSVMEEIKEMTDDELVRIPYFSQESDESWVYTYPSLNISMNRSLEENDEKFEAAIKVMECFLSQEGQELIACGQGMISYNDGIESDLTGMEGIRDEIEKNALYIRYASNNSFSASLETVTGLISGSMNEKQALEAFKKGINKKSEDEDSVVKFDETYKLSLNENGGRDAASSILTTVRNDMDADIAFTSYYSYSSSIYQGECTQTELRMICSNDQGSPLNKVELTGSDIRKLVKGYLKDTGSSFYVSNRYELPVASGMKLILKEKNNGFSLKDIQVNGKSIKADETYKVLISEHIEPVFERVFSDSKTMEPLGIRLSDAWQEAIIGGASPAEPEDYISIE